MPGSVKVTTLCENTVYRRGLMGEHGLALLLETDGRKILFDTGSGLTLIHNAQTLEVELRDLDAVALSHGHYDHTGGLVSLADKSGPISVYAHPEIFSLKYSRHKDEYRYIGPPWDRQAAEGRGVQFIFNRSPVEIGPGVTLTGEIPRSGESGPSDSTLYLKTGRGMKADPLPDDQALIVDSPNGLIAVLGCAHAGLINTLGHILQISGQNEIYALLGGTHLLNRSPAELERTVEQLKDFGLQKIAPCHCTGLPARLALCRAFGDRFLEHRAGSVFVL